MIYLDTSVVAPLYWTEALSDRVEALLRQEVELGISKLVEVELCSVLSRRVRMREIERDEAQAIANRFQTDLNSGFYSQLILEPIHYEMAMQKWQRFKPYHFFRITTYLSVSPTGSLRPFKTPAG